MVSHFSYDVFKVLNEVITFSKTIATSPSAAVFSVNSLRSFSAIRKIEI